MKNLELGRDYINGNGLIVIDRLGDYGNRGFDGNNFEYDLFCSSLYVWREATAEEVIEAFEKHLVYRFGKDWETMKIKERHPASLAKINGGSWNVGVAKKDSWKVWNKNGLLYCNGIWVERLEEEPTKSTDWTPAPEDIEAMNKKTSEKRPIDKVTIKNLDIALRMVGIQLDVNIIDKVIDLVELIENKGDDVTIKDIVSLQQTWKRHILKYGPVLIC